MVYDGLQSFLGNFISQLAVSVACLFVLHGCAYSYTTVMRPKSSILVTTGDLPGKSYDTLGFVETKSWVAGLSLPTEEKISEMKTTGLNDGLIKKAEAIEADAVINIEYETGTNSFLLFLNQFTLTIKGTAVKIK
jgi:uncharacterized protein YbjQ (UPF0145 family)